MFEFLKNRVLPIGIDVAEGGLRIAQLSSNGKTTKLVAGVWKKCPDGIDYGSAVWQRWAIEVMKGLSSNGDFVGKDVIAVMPCSEVFVENIKLQDAKEQQVEQLVGTKIKQRLPFETDMATIRSIECEQDNYLVIATEREKIDRYLAIYEIAGLRLKSLDIWPAALANTYVNFFARRKSDIEAVVILVDIGLQYTNLVICRYKNILFAKSIAMGLQALVSDKHVNRLVSEIDLAKRSFASMYNSARIDRLIFLSNFHNTQINRDLYKSVAKELKLSAQIGDCLEAVEMISGRRGFCPDRRVDVLDTTDAKPGEEQDWAMAFGLSLSGV